MKTDWKIMCSSHTACPDVIAFLKELGFQHVKETPYSPTSDISADCVLKDNEKIKETAEKIFKECGTSIQQITIDSY